MKTLLYCLLFILKLKVRFYDYPCFLFPFVNTIGMR